MRTMTALLGLAATLAAAAPATAQILVFSHYHHRHGPVVPYATPGHGPIATAREASDACADDALVQAHEGAKIAGSLRAATMSTGWEVTGAVDEGQGAVPFICSVRNGSVSALALKRD